MGVLAQLFHQVRVGRADGEHHRLRVEVQLLGGADEEEGVVEVASPHEDVRLQLLELRQYVGDVGGVPWVALHPQHLQAVLSGPPLRALGDAGGEEVVRVGDDNRLGPHLAERPKRGLGVAARGSHHGEQVLVRLPEEGFGRAVALDQDHAACVGDLDGPLGERGAVRPQQEVDLVLVDELLHELSRRVRVAPVVVHDQLDLVAFVA